MTFEDYEYGYGRHMGYGIGRRAGMYGMGGMYMRGHMGRYGFVLNYFILAMASRQKIRGADVMNTVEQLSHGYWRPSPGHVYFELDRLVDEGYLKRTEGEDGKY